MSINFKSCAKAAGVLTLVGVGFYAYKKELKRLNKLEKDMEELKSKEKKAYEEIGVNQDKLEADMEIEPTFIKAVYSASRFNTRFDIDCFDVDEAINSDYTIIITPGYRKNTTDLMVRIPDYTKGGYNDPKIADYIRCINGGLKDLPISKEITKRLALFVNISQDENDLGTYYRIPSEVYSQWADGNRDGMTKFYELFLKSDMDAKVALAQWMDRENLNGKVFVELRYVLTMNDSIMFDNVLDILDKLLNIEISRSENVSPVFYEHLLFMAPNENGVVDGLHYYDTDGGDIIITD